MPKKNEGTAISPQDEQKALYEAWMRDPTSDDSALQEFYNSDRSHELSYLEKNRGFITGSKLETFRKDQWWYNLQFVEEMPMPYALDTTYAPFAIGSCFDDLITYGPKEVEKWYIEMNPRVSNIEDEILECIRAVEEAQNGPLKKDGGRYAGDIEKEVKNKARMDWLANTVRGKTQMTPADMELVQQMFREWNAQKLFDKQLVKKHIFFKLHGEIPVKCELDHHIPHFTNEQCGADDFFAVVDAKTTADIEKSVKFAQDNYASQMSLYALAAEHAVIAKEEVDRKVCAIIQAVDKHGLWSRSAAIYFSPELLKDRQRVLIECIEQCWTAHRTGMFFKSADFLPDCPYYGVQSGPNDPGYGRAQKFFIA